MPNNLVGTGITKEAGRLRNKNLLPTQSQMVSSKLPITLQRECISFERLTAIDKANSGLIDGLLQKMPENVVHLVLEKDNKVQLLSMEELSALKSQSLDEAGIIAAIEG